jgi:Na+/melibiose symporter-like transporter
MNLALAAGLSLPLLGWLGYQPGQQDAQALWALSFAYGAVPCALKLMAAFVISRWFINPTHNGESA